MCPVKDGSLERCVDSSRYFVLKIQNAQGACVRSVRLEHVIGPGAERRRHPYGVGPLFDGSMVCWLAAHCTWTGRHAFIGVAFNEREEAFDFNVALQEYEKCVVGHGWMGWAMG